jgi:hypothetical protein
VPEAQEHMPAKTLLRQVYKTVHDADGAIKPIMLKILFGGGIIVVSRVPRTLD